MKNKTKNKPLSEKVYKFLDCKKPFEFIYPEDVAEAVKKLKEAFPINCREHHKFHIGIDKIMGELKSEEKQ